MKIWWKTVFLVLYIGTICVAVQYKCNYRNTLCGCGPTDVQLATSSLIGSGDVVPNSWPMVVSIRQNLSDKDEHICAGTLLNERYILTAAHCVEKQSSWKITVVTQLNGLSTESFKTYRVDRIYRHPDYENREQSSLNDIALLHLTKAIGDGYVGTKSRTCIPKLTSTGHSSKYPSNTTRLVTTGWIIPKENQSYISDRLQQAAIFVVENENHMCSKLKLDPNKQFCAGFEQGKGSRCSF